MPTAIETAAYGELAGNVSPEGHVGEHCVVEFSMRRNPPDDCSDIVVLGLVPEQREYTKPTVLTFRNAHVGRIHRSTTTPNSTFFLGQLSDSIPQNFAMANGHSNSTVILSVSTGRQTGPRSTGASNYLGFVVSEARA